MNSSGKGVNVTTSGGPAVFQHHQVKTSELMGRAQERVGNGRSVAKVDRVGKGTGRVAEVRRATEKMGKRGCH